VIDVFEIVGVVRVVIAENVFPDGVETMEIMKDIQVDEEVVCGCAVRGENGQGVEIFREMGGRNG
jgi:hypothetical protein